MTHQCDCGCTPPHGTPEECARNHEATGVYLRSVTNSGLDGTIARGEKLRESHATHLTPRYGCPACPLDSGFRRDSAESEWYMPETVR